MKNFSSSNIERFLIAACVALVLPLSAVAFNGHSGGHEACGGPGAHAGPGRAMDGDMLPPHLRGLGLTEGQRDKVFEIMHAQAPAMRDKVKALHKAEEELRGLTAAPDYSEAKARALADAAAKAMADMALAHVKVERQVFDILTPEQRKQLAERKPGEAHGAMTPGA